ALDTTYNAFAVGGFPLTCAAITADGRTWLGGTFTVVNRQITSTRNQLARLNDDGSLDVTYNPGTGLKSATGGTVAPNFLLALDEGRALVTGDFVSVNGVARAQVARLNPQSFGGANNPQLLAVEPAYVEARAGVPFSVKLTGTGSAQ